MVDRNTFDAKPVGGQQDRNRVVAAPEVGGASRSE